MEIDMEASPRDRIVQAARRLFGQKGFHSTSVAELAASAQVAVGQIYRFFPGKDGFVSNVVIRFTGQKALSQEVLDAKGYPGMTPVPVGVSVDVEFYIHYILNADGLIQYIKGAVWVPEAPSA